MRSAFALQALGDFSHIISKRCLLTSLAGECGGGGLESCSVFVCVWVDVLCVCVWQRRRERECVRLCYALQFPWPLCEILLTRRLWAWHTVLRQCRGWEEQSKWWRGSFSPAWQGKQVLEEEPIEDRDGQESAAATHLHRCNAMDAVRWMVDVLQKQAPVIAVFCSRSECASLCTCSSCNNFHKSPAHSWPIRTTLAGDL